MEFDSPLYLNKYPASCRVFAFDMAKRYNKNMDIPTLIYKSLTTEIAPMVYIMMFVSVLVGFFFLTGIDMGTAESILWSTGVLVHKAVWGGILFCTASIALAGMIMKKNWMIQLGGISGFMMWLFASIAMFIAGHWYILLTFALFHLLFHGYVYLATTFGVIYRTTKVRH